MIFTTHKRNRYDLFFRPHGRQLLTWLECQQMVGKEGRDGREGRESVKFNDSTAPHINIDGLICAIAGKHALNCRGVWGDDDARQTK